MRIAVNARFLIKGKMEGFGRYTYELVKRMSAAHPEHRFLLFFDRQPNGDFGFGDNVEHIVIGPQARHPFLYYIWFEISLKRAFKKYKPDVFFSPDAFLSLSARVPTVMTIHDLAFFELPDHIPWLTMKYYKYFVPRFAKRADHIVTITDFVAGDIRKHLHVRENKITVVYNGIPDGVKVLSPEKAAGVSKKYSAGKPYFLYLGSIHPRKNIERLILAFTKFKEESGSDLRLLLCGRLAWDTEHIQKIHSDSPVKHDIQFTGYMDESEMNLLLGAAFALVYVSLHEGFGLPVAEAFKSRVPVITSNVTSLPEVAGDAAITVNPRSVEEIASAMKRMAEDEDLRRSLIEKGMVRAGLFDWESAAGKIYGIINKVYNDTSDNQADA